MTRINLIPPQELNSRHLVAEYRELPRVFALIRRWQESGCPGDIPETYRMGTGHVRFFYDKASWLAQRQRLLIGEMRRRGMTPNFGDPEELLADIRDEGQIRFWAPTPEEIRINQERISLRLREMDARKAITDG